MEQTEDEKKAGRGATSGLALAVERRRWKAWRRYHGFNMFEFWNPNE